MDALEATPNAEVPEEAWAAIRRALALSPRQMEVLRGIYRGRKYAQIAEDLGITRHTVDIHWREIKRKLGLPEHAGHLGHKLAIERVNQVLMHLRLEAAAAPLQATIADLQRQVDALQEEVDGLRAREAERRVVKTPAGG